MPKITKRDITGNMSQFTKTTGIMSNLKHPKLKNEKLMDSTTPKDNILLFAPKTSIDRFASQSHLTITSLILSPSGTHFLYKSFSNPKEILRRDLRLKFDYFLLVLNGSLSFAETKLAIYDAMDHLTKEAIVVIKTPLEDEDTSGPLREFCEKTFNAELFTVDSPTETTFYFSTNDEIAAGTAETKLFDSLKPLKLGEIVSKTNEKEPKANPKPFAKSETTKNAKGSPKTANMAKILWKKRKAILDLSHNAFETSLSAALTASTETLQPSSKSFPPLCVSGVSVGLPNKTSDLPFFHHSNAERLLSGEVLLDALEDCELDDLLTRRVFQLDKSDGQRRKKEIRSREEMFKLTSRLGQFDLKELGVPPHIIEGVDKTSQLGIGAGLEALRNAGIEMEERDGYKFALPEAMRDTTGIIFASSFPVLQSSVEAALKAERGEEFDRKLLFKLLVPANCQLAQLTGARGPNTIINAACASTAQALAMAGDWMALKRCSRVLVVAADNASSPELLPFVGNGFLALGACSTEKDVSEAAVPFDRRRNGMLLGMGAVGILLETANSAGSRGLIPRAQLVRWKMANSATHATLLDKSHIAKEMKGFVDGACSMLGLSRSAMAHNLLYFAHETGTHKNGGCALAEVEALRESFGVDAAEIIICAVKGAIGHSMGANLEDAAAVLALETEKIPPVAHYRCRDERLGELSISRGGSHSRKFALRLAAGFGGQLVLLLYRRFTHDRCAMI